MITYKGFKTREIGSALVWKDNSTLSPGPSREVWNHSYEFEWGYEGSGPAQLALALLLDVAGSSKLAVQLHQDFKTEFVASWGEEWEITSDQIQGWIKTKLAPLYEKLAAWINTNVIAENILDCLQKADVQLTEFNGQAVWLDILYTELPEALARSTGALINKCEIS
jgi:hypothetical protein